jgi:hypothetical protein
LLEEELDSVLEAIRLIEELKVWIQKTSLTAYRVAAMLDISQSWLNDIIHEIGQTSN